MHMKLNPGALDFFARKCLVFIKNMRIHIIKKIQPKCTERKDCNLMLMISSRYVIHKSKH